MKIATGLAAHPFLTLAVVGVLLGGGLRYLPANASASTSAGSTACAAT